MIVRGHVHDLKPSTTFDRPDGGRVIHSRCQAVQATPEHPAPPCTLEQELIFQGDTCVRVRYRYGGMWLDAFDLLRMLPIGVAECPVCEGAPMLAPCERCGGLGVTDEAGRPISAPDLHVRA